jgi:hypothetical protein
LVTLLALAVLLALVTPLAFAMTLTTALAALVALVALLIPSTTMAFSSILFHVGVSGVSSKGRRASSSTTASGYAANHASKHIGNMCIGRVCSAIGL